MLRSVAFGASAAVLAALTLYGTLRNGMSFTPDSWALWQGSVSLLSGHGYRYADGHPLIFWPPGFAAYLAAWQGVFGVSVATLIKAQIALAAFAAFGWTSLAIAIGRVDRRTRLASGLATALLIAAVVGRSFVTPWANFELFALVPWLLWAMVRLDDARTSEGTLPWAGLASLALLLMLLAHNSAIAFLPPLLAVAISRKGVQRWQAAAIVLVAPFIWWLVRGFLGQRESVEWIGGRHSLKDYVRQLLSGIAEPFGSAFVPGAIVLVVVLALIPWRRLSRAQFLALATSAAACVGLLGVFSVVWIWDGLYQRFTLFFPLTLIGVIGSTFLLHAGALRTVAAIVVIGWVGLATIDLVRPFLHANSQGPRAAVDVLDPSVLPLNATLSREVSANGGFVLVEPPKAPRNHAEMMELLATGKYGR